MPELNPRDAWSQCLDIIRDNVNRQSFRTWFEPIEAVSLEQKEGKTRLTVQLPSRFYYEWLEQHYYALLRKTITHVLGPGGQLYYDIVMTKEAADEPVAVHLPARPPDTPPRVEAPPQPPSQEDAPPAPGYNPTGGTAPSRGPRPPAPQPDAGYGLAPANRPHPSPAAPAAARSPQANPFAIPGVRKPPLDPQLAPNCTFDRLIEGDCNKFARSTAWAIAQEPGATAFNPFLVYGGVGLGKTHLVQAIGNYARAHRKAERILYVSSERFTSDFVHAIKNGRASEFSMLYRQVDLLIVDDVQFFGGKEKTQEEFFHIFNDLHLAGKQIVLSADRPPKDIQGIEERLLSRFQWGLVADVQQPDLETREAILLRRAEDDGLELPADVIEYIATHVKSNVRELEGALIRLLATSQLHGGQITLETAREVLRDLIKESRKQITVEDLQRITCDYFGVDEDLVRAKTRKREVVQARQVAMFFAKEYTDHSLKTIGSLFGGRDHSTVIHSINSVRDQQDTDASFRERVGEVRRRIELYAR
jgi:chromosomal replication initiator protein